ncbi:radical SAM protein [Candidatus Parcubacteria bacterium]|nr:radical SAM protein [Candidatus Parcubacteria bacterium]
MNLTNALMHANFLKKKPLVIIKVANGYFRGLVLKKPVLRTVDFAITNLCNSKCKMCSARLLYRHEDRKILNPDEIVSAFLEASRLGAMHINLTGGEPFMRPLDELVYIIKNIKPRRHLISLVTNSLLATKDRLEKLKKAGLDTIQLSIESLTPEIHDDIRGVPGNFDKVMAAYEYSKELGFLICLSTVITHTNFDEIKKIIAFSQKDRTKGVFVLLNPISASGAMVGNTQLKLTSDDLDKYNRLLEISNVRADTIVNFSGQSGCPAGKERIHITAYGDVITCPHVQISYGNVRKKPLKKIWKKMYNFPYLQKYSPVCKHAFDQAYYDKFLKPIENTKRPPIKVEAHPSLKNEIK